MALVGVENFSPGPCDETTTRGRQFLDPANANGEVIQSWIAQGHPSWDAAVS